MASDSPGTYSRSHEMSECDDLNDLLPDTNGIRGNFPMGVVGGFQRDNNFVIKDSGYYVSTSDGASTCSSSTTEAGENEGGTLLVLEPKSLRSFTTNDEYLYAMKEDLADWFACLYQRDDITADNFFQMLETGVLLCKHANKVQEFARQRREMGETLEMRSYFIRSVPEGNVSYREGVKPETFQARDNVSNFISWGRQLGIPEVLSFETDDLVLRKNEKSVTLCLLEIARVGAKLGMLAPTLIQMEQEIDAELAGEEPKPQIQIITCDMRSLDERVRDLIGRCTCPIQFPMIKVGEGKYKIGDSRTLIFVRILRNHVMVRVGGGWDTLENYLNKHDPCQCNYRGHRPSNSGITHKVVVSQQRQPSTSNSVATRPIPGTPTSPRRGSSAAAARNRSSSPHSSSSSKNPTLVISRHMPVPTKSGTNHGNQTKTGLITSSQGQQAVTSKDLSQLPCSSSSQPVRSKTPSPVRHRSPSPHTTPQDVSQPTSVYQTSSGSIQVRKNYTGQESKKMETRKDAAVASDNEDDEVSDNDGYFAEDDECECPQVPREKGSGSFDGRTDLHSKASDLIQERDPDITSLTDGTGKANVSIDKISTMTLAEFKSLLSSSLSVPEEQKQGHSDRSDGRLQGQSQGSSSCSEVSRPRTPASISRTRTPKESGDIERTAPKEEYKMARPKLPSQIKRDAVAKVAGAISNWVESRSEVDSARTIPSRPKTPTRPKTLVSSDGGNMSQNLLHANGDSDHLDVTSTAANTLIQELAIAARDRPATPSRIPKPSFIPRSNTPKTPSSITTEFPGDVNSQLSQQGLASNLTRLNITSSCRPAALSRSNSNSSSVKSVDDTPISPASSYSEDRVFKIHTRRRPSNSSDGFNSNNNSTTNSNNNNTGRSYKDIYTAKRAGTSDGRILQTRAVTPGPREKWTLGGISSGGSIENSSPAPNSQRRRSINTTCLIDKQRPNISASSLGRAASASNIETEQEMAITNEITFSDDEEINELVKNAALKARTHSVRSSSVDARKYVQHSTKENEEEVLMIRRDLPMKDSMNSDSAAKFSIMRRPASRGSSTDRSSPATIATRLPQAPNSSRQPRKIVAVGRNKEQDETSSTTSGDEYLNRTEAWVDSTISDTKMKPLPKTKRIRRSETELAESELASRPLEEIQAILTETRNGFVRVDTKTLEPPPEDLEMFKKMEKLFEKYKEMELKASVNETSSGGGTKQVSVDKIGGSHSAKGDSQGSTHGASKSSKSLALPKSSSGFSGNSSGRNSAALIGGRASTNEDNKCSRSSSNQVPFQIQQPRCSSSISSALASPSMEANDYFTQNNTNHSETLSQNLKNSEPDNDHIGLGILQDIDPEVVNNPAALISKIKEILKVRPRKDENTKGHTRIPAPAPTTMNKSSRSKSVSNLYSDSVVNTGHSPDITSAQQDTTGVLHNINSGSYCEDPSNNYQSFKKSDSLVSGKIAASECDKAEDPADEVSDLTHIWSVQPDVSDNQNRSETPVPKLATPLTTGRSTLISRRKSLSQDKENLSNSQTAVTGILVMSPTEDEAEFV